MKIAVLADIHGNHIALESVLKEIKDLAIQQLLVLGDLVGYYYHPDKVINLLKPWEKIVIQGNHEDMLIKAKTDKVYANQIRQKYGSGINIALKKIDKRLLNKLIKLPAHKLITIEKLKIELCHGSPWNRDVYIYPDADKKILEKCTINASDFVLMGHTHYPFVYKINRSIVANVGSVGQARDKGRSASWALIDTKTRKLTLIHTPYDPSNIINEVKKTDPEIPYLYRVLTRNN